MAKRVFWMKYKWLCLVSGGSILVGGFNYLKNRQPCNALGFVYDPSIKWDNNWDKRDFSSLIKPSKSIKNSDEQQSLEEKKLKLTPTATRHILLIRHGQYEDWKDNDLDRKLTPLGLKQAAIVGQRLRDLNLTYSRLIHSSLTRAKETSALILPFLDKGIPVECSELLCEGNPIPSEPPIGTWREEFKYHEDGPRIEAAFRKYFHRADAKQKTDSCDIIVCHANVIRYFVCRLLQVPPEAWLRFSLHHCSITWCSISPNGHVRLFSIGDSGFMPRDKLTKFF